VSEAVDKRGTIDRLIDLAILLTTTRLRPAVGRLVRGDSYAE